jgi:protein-disulfide isomerase
LLASSCEKKDAGKVDTGAAAALDRATFEQEEKGGAKLPIEGVDLKALDEKQVARYNKLIDSLVSPCGKAESLRKSATVTRGCKRSLHAARYIVLLLVGGVEDEDLRKFYADRYVNRQNYKFALNDKMPHEGPADAPVVVVEFYDYGCPVCVQTHPMIEELLKAYPQDVVVYYKQNPITDRHPNSGTAAQAALAAHKQGKFKEMHEKLMATTPIGNHKRDVVWGYAKEIGLDMAKFEKDFAAAEAEVAADDAEGNKADVKGTPTLFFNGHRFEDPLDPSLFASWVEEELAVNR